MTSPAESHGNQHSFSALLSDELLLRALAESPDGLIVCDANGHIRFANESAARVTGYEIRELLDLSIEALVPDSVRDRHAELRAGYIESPRRRPMGRGPILTARRADGRLVPVEISLSPVSTADGILTIASIRDISDRLEDAARLQSTQEMLTLSSERERIARDLHDTVLQRLFGLGLELQALSMNLPQDAMGRIEHAVDEIDLIIQEVRTSVFTLGAAQREGSLGQELGAILAQSARVLGFSPRLRIEGPVENSVSPGLRPDLTATIREALANIARHSQATAASVDIALEGNLLTLRVRDNGIGLPENASTVAGNGLHNMRMRAISHRGYADISSAPGGGTLIEWVVEVA